MASEPFSSSLRLPSPAAQKPAAARGEGRAKEAAGMNHQDSNRYNQGDPKQNRKLDEKYCQSCGAIIKSSAEVCPGCGVRQKGMINKAALLLVTFFLGGLGVHKFYTGRNLQGTLCILFCWTGIPALISLIEFIIYAFTSSERLNEKYQSSGSALIIACVAAGVGMIYLLGLLAAISIPQFIKYRDRAYQAGFKSELQKFITAEELYFLQNNKYTSDLIDLQLTHKTPFVEIDIISADKNCFEARVTHAKLHKSVVIDCHGLDQYPDE
jgi:TM2 domain-containing membrane protein YozV/Tfp pilus assembly protein PilE